MIWVWPGPIELADDNDIPDVRPGRGVDATPGYPEQPSIEKAFDLDCDHSLMIENLLDPAHLPFTHVGTISKRSEMRPIRADTTITETEAILTVFSTLKKGGEVKDKVASHFFPPCHVQVNRGIGMHQRMHCVPLRPGHMRLLYYFGRNFIPWIDRMPIVYDYFDRLVDKIVFQDYELLHGQTLRLRQGANPWQTPIQADLPPKKYRQWITSALKESDLSTWFKGYSTDIEDLVVAKAKSNNSCLLYSSACDLYSAADEAHTYPKQRNVNDLCYTNPKQIEYIVNGKPKGSFTDKLWRFSFFAAICAVGVWFADSKGAFASMNLKSLNWKWQ
jgi:chlorophyllide a oxygenase